MYSSAYNRIESRAGGAFASPLAFYRVFWSMLHPESKQRKNRETRHSVAREMFAMRARSQTQYFDVMGGEQ